MGSLIFLACMDDIPWHCVHGTVNLLFVSTILVNFSNGQKHNRNQLRSKHNRNLI